MSVDRRQMRKETELMQSESRWLQKARFALGKVHEARQKLAESQGTEPEPLTLSIQEKPVALADVNQAFVQRIDDLMSTIQQRREVIR